MHQNKKHIPVLLRQVLSSLSPKKGETYLDLTAGYGGHAKAILDKTNNWADSVLVDRDKEAVKHLKTLFKEHTGLDIRQGDFGSISKQLLEEKRSFDLILADLGVSSQHFNEASRGFAILKEGPLDMRMDQSKGITAKVIVNDYSEAKLTELIKSYGEEPKAHKIAHLIVLHRPIETTTQLAKIVAKAWPGHSRVHPATKTFQAIRIAVNDELTQLEESLPIWTELLNPGGRIAVISFHSLEDRMVKQHLQSLSGDRYDAQLKLVNKHPITSDAKQIVFNPRSRSAKLRVAVKINNKRKGTTNAYSGKK